MAVELGERELLGCCGSSRFASEMAKFSPFASYDRALEIAKDIWLNMVDTNGWLEAFSAHPQIGDKPTSQWSKGEQSTAMATATNSNLQELHHWNIQYKKKFGFIFIIRASGRTTTEILAELKSRYLNRPIVELEIAALEQLKITELRLAKLFESKSVNLPSHLDTDKHSSVPRPSDARLNKIGARSTDPVPPVRTRPPITTHVLDVAVGSPAAGIEVMLEKWNGPGSNPSFGFPDSSDKWKLQGSSITDADGRSGQLLPIIDSISPGIYRISFNTGKYSPNGFFPYVSILFKIKENQTSEHFHVPLLLSPFSFSTYRGS